MTHLKTGDKAPDFTSVNQHNETVNLSDYQGQKVVLYFYPKDNTPTCTKQACNLRDNYELLQENGYTVLGVSPDGVKSHTNFIKKHELPFTLLVDTDKTIANAYGVYGEKKFMGRVSMGIHRTTFVINEQGILENVITKVKSKEHTEQILAAS